MEADLAYYRRRSGEERVAAAAARDERVRAVHDQLAQAYEEKVAALETGARGARLRPVPAA